MSVSKICGSGQNVTIVPVDQAAEADTAQPLTRRKLQALGIPIETDLAQALTRRKAQGLGLTTETDLAQAFSWSPKIRIVGQVAEIDLAQPMTLAIGDVIEVVRITTVRGASPRLVALVGRAPGATQVTGR